MPSRANQYRKRPPSTAAPRPTSSARGYGWRWQKFRKAYLASHPLCTRCEAEGKVCAAVHLHHKDWKGPNGPLGFDESNIEPLCVRHHNSLTAKGNPT